MDTMCNVYTQYNVTINKIITKYSNNIRWCLYSIEHTCFTSVDWCSQKTASLYTHQTTDANRKQPWKWEKSIKHILRKEG